MTNPNEEIHHIRPRILSSKRKVHTFFLLICAAFMTTAFFNMNIVLWKQYSYRRTYISYQENFYTMPVESNETTVEKPRRVEKGLVNVRQFYDLIIVGAGLSGSVFAERAQQNGLTSLIIDKRDHIGGNCFDYVDSKGFLINKYGVHIFHTKSPIVWDYVRKFSKFTKYAHRVVGKVKDVNGTYKMVPIPPIIRTVNSLFGINMTTEKEMEKWLEKSRPNLHGVTPRNGEEMSMSRVGRDLYEMIFKPYTKKQWDKWPSELDASVLARLPFRLNNDDRYFDDPFQALPAEGYTKMFENMILKSDNIDVRLSVDYFKVKHVLPRHKVLVFTGPIDAYFSNSGMPPLEYRSIVFEHEYLKPPGGYFQPNLMVNYPGSEFKWTRIAEYKHSPNQPKGVKESPWTLIVKEYSTDKGDPYYPVPNERNQQLYEKYKAMSMNLTSDVVFVGRLASYKYFNMDQAILNALELFQHLTSIQVIGLYHNWA